MRPASIVIRSVYPLCLVSVTALSLVPRPPRIDIDIAYLDKIEHAIVYIALGFLGHAFFGDLGKPGVAAFFLSVGIGLAVGVSIEFIQPFVGRNFELADMAVDLGGLCVGALSACIIKPSARLGPPR
jgi:VanZ family protein